MTTTTSLQTDEYMLWLCFKNGDLKAFSAIYESNIGVLYNYGRHIINDDSLVKDAIQDLFTDLWRNRENLSPTTSIKFYLFRSLRRRIHLATKQKNLFTSLTDISLTHIETFSAEQSIIENELKQEQIIALRLAILNLPERQNEVIRLYFFDGFDFEEIAGIMQVNEQSARNLFYRSINKLKLHFSLPV